LLQSGEAAQNLSACSAFSYEVSRSFFRLQELFMAKQRAIVYFMHETELHSAEQAMSSALVTDSFAIGEMEDTKIAELRKQGIIVNLLPSPTAPQEWSSTDAPESSTLGFEITRSAADAFDAAIPNLVDFYSIRLTGPLLEPWRKQLEDAGVGLLQRDGNGGYRARLSAQQVAAVNALDFVESVQWITPKQSAPRQVTQSISRGPGAPPATGLRMLTFDVRLHVPEDNAKVVQWLHDHHLTVSGAKGRKIRLFAVENSPVLSDLALLSEVDMIAEYVVPELYNDVARRILGVEGQGNPARCLTQDGTGETVAVADTGIDDTHPDFAGRIATKIARGRLNDASDPNGHGTHVAGSVLGDGSASNGQYQGIAPKANLIFQSLLDSKGGLGGLPLDLNDLFDEAYVGGARIHNNSWGASTPSLYNLNSEEVDEFVRKHPDMLVVIAAGNAGSGASPKKATAGFVDWLSIGSPASCKNALTVGASRSDRANGPMSSLTWGQGWPQAFPDPPIANETISGNPNSLAAFSSRGPCDDRRIKPDVVAPGTEIISTKSSAAPVSNFWGVVQNNTRYAYDGGTSMATPLVSGCAALVRQYYVQERKHQPSAALLKATLVNSTQWLTGADSVAPSAGRPNYHQGHGRIDMRMAIPNACQPALQLQFVDNWEDRKAFFTRTGERKRYQFILPAGVPELRICLAYTDAPARALQNNLNLIVQHLESNQKWMGNQDLPDALVIPDPDNNVEAVKIQNPAPGTYFIQVFVGNLLQPPQDFALVVTGIGVPALVQI
jgi:serine protease AprX